MIGEHKVETRFNPEKTLSGTCSDVAPKGTTAYFEKKS